MMMARSEGLIFLHLILDRSAGWVSPFTENTPGHLLPQTPPRAPRNHWNCIVTETKSFVGEIVKPFAFIEYT